MAQIGNHSGTSEPSETSETIPVGGRKAVIVGVAQYRKNPKLDGAFEPWEPARAMADAIERAVADAGAYGDATASTIHA